jgi:hypothetical protein
MPRLAQQLAALRKQRDKIAAAVNDAWLITLYGRS